MNSNKSLKIEFQTSEEARKCIANNSTSIGGIQLHKSNKELHCVPQKYPGHEFASLHYP